MECGLGLGRKFCQSVKVKRFFTERPAKGHAPARVIEGQSETAPHQGDGADAVPEARDIEHRRDVAYAVGCLLHKLRGRPRQRQLRGRNLARAELIFKTIDLKVAKPPFGVSRLDIEESEALAAGGVALRSRQGQ